MKIFAILCAVFVAAAISSDTPPEGIAPSEPSPEGCKDTVDGNFTLGTLILKPGMEKRESAVQASTSNLVCTLQDGILHDPLNRTASIVANYQFQFDGPPQAGAIYTGGWSVCPNGTLAIGGTTMFYRCDSGGFVNLYDRWIAGQCEPAHIIVSLANAPTPSSSASSTASGSSVPATGSMSASPTGSALSASATGIAVSTMHNGTVVTASPSPSTSRDPAASTLAPASSIRGGADAPPASSTGGAVPTRVPRRETFGAVVGILGAALLL